MPKPEPLKVLFPSLPFAEAADAFLAVASEQPLYRQITDRRIYEFRQCPLLVSAAGLCRRAGGGFFIQFDNLVDTERKVCSLGHEMAHTFGFDIRFRHPKRLLPRRLDDATADRVEEFCGAFSGRWLALQNKEKVCKLLESELRMSRLEIMHLCYL